MFRKKKNKEYLEINQDNIIGVTTLEVIVDNNVKTKQKYLEVKRENYKNEKDLMLGVAVIAKTRDDFNGDYYVERSNQNDNLQFSTKMIYLNKKGEHFYKVKGKQKVLSKESVKMIKKRYKQLKRKFG